MKRIALVTGATRGIGWGVAQALSRKGFHLSLLGRNAGRLAERKKELEARGGEASTFLIDLSKPASIEECIAELKAAFPAGIHLLVNNAGIFPESGGAYSPDKVRETLQTNTLGPLQLTKGIEPLILKGHANVVNISSGMGGLKEMNAGYPGYRISKTALNAVTRYLSQEWLGKGVRVNSVCPGWVRTDMGGAGAERSIEEGVASVLWAAMLPENGPSGGFFRDGQPLDW